MTMARLGAGLALALLLAGCSMAGMPKFAPAPAKTKAVAETSVKTSVSNDDKEEGGVFVALAYAEPEPVTRSGGHGGSANVNALISKYADVYDVPESLIHRLVQRESGYNPKARNGPYFGLMQIRHDTARSMGYRGDASGLLDADTNLRYAVKYLRGAYIVAGNSHDGAVRNYSRGYYYDAKRKGLLKEAGLR
jgi:soluble lytic murein transglycosylase-like protein